MINIKNDTFTPLDDKTFGEVEGFTALDCQDKPLIFIVAEDCGEVIGFEKDCVAVYSIYSSDSILEFCRDKDIKYCKPILSSKDYEITVSVR